MPEDFWIKVLQFILVPAVSSVVAVYIAYGLGKRQRSFEIKTGVLRELIGRRADFGDQDFIIALNSVPVIFSCNNKIKSAWKDFYEVVRKNRDHPGSIAQEVVDERFIILTLAICRSLKIKANRDDIFLVFKSK